MDFAGQKLADTLCTVLLWVGAAVAFILGYVLKNFEIMFKFYAGCVILTLLVVVPDWPFYNKNPIEWSTASRIKAEGRDANDHEGTPTRRRNK